jgi:hypothetical protein
MTRDCAEMRRLHTSEQMSIEAIVRKTGSARNTVRAALAAGTPAKYERGAVGSLSTCMSRGSRHCWRSSVAVYSHC